MEYTLEELLIARMARAFKGERIATGATFLGDIAARLAKLLHDPDLILVGGLSHAAFDCDAEGAQFGGEWSAHPSSRMVIGWEEIFDSIAHGKLQIFIGPVQLDRRGNANISAIGSWQQPRIQLIGARGLPDDLWGNDEFFYHVRRHSRHCFVEQVDVVCSLGFGEERERLGLTRGWPGVVVSDLGVFDWDRERGEMRIETLHPGVSFDLVQERTGFRLSDNGGRPYPVTAAPTAEELDLIRNVVDPSGWRRMDSREASPELLLALCDQEKVGHG